MTGASTTCCSMSRAATCRQRRISLACSWSRSSARRRSPAWSMRTAAAERSMLTARICCSRAVRSSRRRASAKRLRPVWAWAKRTEWLEESRRLWRLGRGCTMVLTAAARTSGEARPVDPSVGRMRRPASSDTSSACRGCAGVGPRRAGTPAPPGRWLTPSPRTPARRAPGHSPPSPPPSSWRSVGGRLGSSTFARSSLARNAFTRCPWISGVSALQGLCLLTVRLFRS